MSHDSESLSLAEELADALLRGRDAPHGQDGIPDRTLADLGWDAICTRIADACQTDPAIDVARTLGFLPRAELVHERHAEVREAMQAAVLDDLPSLRGARSLRRTLQRARRQEVLSGEELLDTGRTARVAAQTRSHLHTRRERMPRIAARAATLHDLRALADELIRSFEPNGELADATYPELARLRRRVFSLRTTIQDRLQRILRSPRYEGILQDEFVTIRDERYVVPVRSGERGDFPGIVHGHSNTGATLFIEPEEIVGLNNEFRMAQLDVEQETRRILAMLTGKVAASADALADNEALLTWLDLTCATALAARDEGWTLPRVAPASRGGRVAMRAAAHPVLQMRAAKGELALIRNTIEFDPGARLLVISGPNTGGKTVTLKTVGIAALMVRAGLPVCAREDSAVPFFARVFCDIGDEQAIERDLSTFSAHLRNLTAFLPDCDEDALVLLDELFAGTDPEQGAALGRAVLEDLAQRGSTVIVTTHLERLKTLALEDTRFACASVTFDVERFEPTYVLRMGVPGSSYALRIAERLGLSRRIVERAGSLLTEGESLEREELIARLEEEHRRVAELREASEREQRHLEQERARLEKARRALEERGKGAIDDASREAVESLRSLRKAMRDLERARPVDGDRAAHEAWLREARETVQRVDERVRREKEEEERQNPTPGATLRPGDLSVGDVVFVRPFAKTGTVVELPREDRVVVQLGTMRASFSPEELRREAAAKAAAPPPVRTSAVAPTRASRDMDRNPSATLDLRGHHAEDAIERLDAWLDRASRTEQAFFTVIHGHGTGVLKRAVREHLARCGYPLRYRPGERTEGGDGVTVVELYDAPPAD